MIQKGPVNPYQYVGACISGKWKMTILHHIHNYGSIRFNLTRRVLPISEKVLAQQLSELQDMGVIDREVYETKPLKVRYVLTPSGEELVAALDLLYIWSVRQMTAQGVEIDPDAFVVHNSDKYLEALEGIVDINKYLIQATAAVEIDQLARDTCRD